MLKENKGSLTVEASLSLIIFIFAFLSILYLCKFARAQIVLQHAVNQTAKEISQYSYLTNKLGLKNDKTKGDKAIEDTDKMISELNNLINLIGTEKKELENLDISNDYVINDYYDAIKVYKKYDDAGNKIKDSYQKIDNAANVFVGNAQEYLKDPKALLNGFVEIAKNEIADFAVSKYIAVPMSKLLIEKYLPSNFESTDEYLIKLGIDNGLDGLNFDTSTIFKDGSDINITLIYNMSLNIPLFPDKTLCFRVNASTIGWQSKLFNENRNNDDSSSDYINIWDYGWKERTDEFIKILMKENNLSGVRTPLSLDFYDYSTNLYTYVHSMNTELSSYSNDGELNLSSIKSKVKLYAKDAVKDTKRADKITMEDGTVYESSDIKDNQNIKIIMVVQESASGSIEELNKIVTEIKKELKCDNLEIEFYFSDGLIQVGGQD